MLGKYATAAEAALAYARAIGPAEVSAAAAALPGRPLSAREVAAAVRAEGLSLKRSATVASGYAGVSIGSGERIRPYNVVWCAARSTAAMRAQRRQHWCMRGRSALSELSVPQAWRRDRPWRTLPGPRLRWKVSRMKVRQSDVLLGPPPLN